MKRRKKVFYVDFDHIEFGKRLTKLESRVREKLLTTQEMDKKMFWDDVKEGLKTLTKTQRKCFVAALIEGYGEDQIAEELGIRQQSVYRRIEAAKVRMKSFLGKYYQPHN